MEDASNLGLKPWEYPIYDQIYPVYDGVLGLAWLADNDSAISLLMFLLLELRVRLLLHEDEERKPMGQPKRGRYGSVDGKGGGGRLAVRWERLHISVKKP